MMKNKIQALIVEHLLKHGQLEIVLPDGVTLEIGLTQEDKQGEQKIVEDYCWVIASRAGRATSLDAFNMGLRFSGTENILVFEDNFTDQDGKEIRRLDVI